MQKLKAIFHQLLILQVLFVWHYFFAFLEKRRTMVKQEDISSLYDVDPEEVVQRG